MANESLDQYRLDQVEAKARQALEELDEVRDELAILPVLKRILYWVAVLLTGSIIAVVGAAVTVLLTAGGAK